MDEQRISEYTQIRYHILYDENLTLKDLEDLLHLLRVSNNNLLCEMGFSRAKGNELQKIEKIEPGSINLITFLKEILSITEDGYAKRSSLSEFKITGRGTKGVKIQKGDNLIDFLPIENNEDVLINSTSSQIRIKLEEIPLLSRGTLGAKSIKLKENSKISKLSKI